MLLAIAIILIILISTMIVVIITSLDSFNEDIIRIDEAVSNIENVLNKRFDLLSKSIDVIKKHLNKDNITIKTIDENTQDTDEIWIPEKIARLIPYFIKGDLYQEEEPDLAADARNIFEASLDDFKVQNQSKQDYVHRTFRLQ